MFGTKIQKNWNVWTQTSQDSFAKNEQWFIHCHGSVRPEHNINTDKTPAEKTQKESDLDCRITWCATHFYL